MLTVTSVTFGISESESHPTQIVHLLLLHRKDFAKTVKGKDFNYSGHFNSKYPHIFCRLLLVIMY